MLKLHPRAVVLARLFSAAADRDNSFGIIGIGVKQCGIFGIKLCRPAVKSVIHLLGCHVGQHVTRYVVELDYVEQTAGRAHLFYAEGEISIRPVGVLHVPLLVIGVEQCHDILAYTLGRIA